MSIDPHELLLQHPDITLVRTRLPDCHLGRWYPEHRAIVLQVGLTRGEERCTLLHELVHALRDDGAIDDCWLQGKQERHCHEMVARALIPLPRLVAALRWDRDEYELALELDVDLETFRMRIDTLSPAESRALDEDLAEVEVSA